MPAPLAKQRVLVIDDDPFAASLVGALVTQLGFDSLAVRSAEAFSDALEEFDPHVVIVDLQLGPGPSGLALLKHVQREAPWIGKIMLTSHRAPRLATDESPNGIEGLVYIVKSDLDSPDKLAGAIQACLVGEAFRIDSGDAVMLTRGQADVLRMIAAGMSNDAIAQARGSSSKAVEQLIRRTFAALGIKADGVTNARVLAASMVSEAKVTTTD